ncbi:MAG: hypothetical protein AAGM38_07685 [Pseudomonadota bacterium]
MRRATLKRVTLFCAVAASAAPVWADEWGTTLRRAPPPAPALAPAPEGGLLLELGESGLSFRSDVEPIREGRAFMARQHFGAADGVTPYVGAGVVAGGAPLIYDPSPGYDPLATFAVGVQGHVTEHELFFAEAQWREGGSGGGDTVLWIGVRHSP